MTTEKDSIVRRPFFDGFFHGIFAAGDGKWFVAITMTPHGVVRVASDRAYYYHKTSPGARGRL